MVRIIVDIVIVHCSRSRVSRHTFSLSFDSYVNRPTTHVCNKAEQSAFTQASFSSLSDVHECSGGLQMAPSSLDKQTANCDSPHDWLMSLAII